MQSVEFNYYSQAPLKPPQRLWRWNPPLWLKVPTQLIAILYASLYAIGFGYFAISSARNLFTSTTGASMYDILPVVGMYLYAALMFAFTIYTINELRFRYIVRLPDLSRGAWRWNAPLWLKVVVKAIALPYLTVIILLYGYWAFVETFDLLSSFTWPSVSDVVDEIGMLSFVALQIALFGFVRKL